MALDYILRRFMQRTGINCIDTSITTADEYQRKLALDIINEAAAEIYNALDLEQSLREVVLRITSNRVMALPSFVGKLRGIREYVNETAWKLSDLRPRYKSNSWSDQEVRNIRDKGLSPLYTTLTNTAPLSLSVNAVESPAVVVTITGATANSGNIEEIITLDSVNETLTTSFTEIHSIKKNRINDYNIIVKDADANEVSVLYNDEMQAQYRLVDVAEFISAPSEPGSVFSVEVLYKKRLKPFYRDSDEFPIPDYDAVVVNKALQIWAETKGDIKGALAYDTKATRVAMQNSLDLDKGKVLKVIPDEHPHVRIFRRLRRMPRIFGGNY